MRSWWWLSLLAGSLALAGPFELVPAGQSSYGQLAVLRRAGLLSSSGLDQPEAELTRFEFARLWSVAYDELERRVETANAGVGQPDPQVVKVTAAMAGLLTIFGDEIEQREIDIDAARVFLRSLPSRLTTLQVAPAPAPATATATATAPASVGETYQPQLAAWRDDPFVVREDSFLVPGGGGSSVGRRLALPGFGPASAGLSLSQVALFEYDEDGPTDFLKGHVLAADLRLRMGDNSVLLEYARSASERFGALFEGQAGDAFKATYEREVTRNLSFDVGLHRLSSKFTPFSDVFGGAASPDVYGVRAGVAYDAGRFGVRSHATVYRPEGERVGYANLFDAAMRYRVNDNFQLGVGFMTSTRRRLHNLEDAMLRQVNASLEYGFSDTVWASMKVTIDSDESGGSSSSDQYIGASLGLGF